MSETTQPTAEAAAQAPATGSQLTTASSVWAMKAEVLPNKDLHVQTTDPIFDGQTKRITFLAPQLEEDEGNESARVIFRIDEEIVTVEGDRKAPGHVISPFPRRLRVRDDAPAKDKERCQKDLRGLAIDLQALGLLPKRKDPSVRDIYLAIDRLEGKQAAAKFSVVNGSQRDPETGEFKRFQNIRFAPAGAAAEGNGGAATAAPAGDY